MRAVTARLPLFAAALWWGSLSVIGFLVVPMLFALLPTPAMAGNLAARLFTAQTWVSVACGLVLIVASRPGGPSATARRADAALVFVLLGLLLALLVEFAVAPHIRARENLRLWHSAGTVMYAVQWLCAAAVLWRMAADTQEQP